MQLRELILGERLGGEKVERATLGLAQDAIEDRKVIAESLSRRGGCDHHDVLPCSDPLERLALVGVELFDTPAAKGIPDLGRELFGKLDEVGGLRRKMPERGDALKPRRFAFELRDDVLESAASIDRRQDLRHWNASECIESRKRGTRRVEVAGRFELRAPTV